MPSSSSPSDWRDYEREIANVLRQEGFELDEDMFSDIITTRGWDLNITYLAKKLWERFHT